MKRRAEELTKELVDTEETGKQLLKNGDLRSRVTIIPLNKIQTEQRSSQKSWLIQKKLESNY